MVGVLAGQYRKDQRRRLFITDAPPSLPRPPLYNHLCTAAQVVPMMPCRTAINNTTRMVPRGVSRRSTPRRSMLRSVCADKSQRSKTRQQARAIQTRIAQQLQERPASLPTTAQTFAGPEPKIASLPMTAPSLGHLASLGGAAQKRAVK